ncbi:MAG: hypothetical protein AAFZ65_15820, partial [Planctomycetota bacterium]
MTSAPIHSQRDRSARPERHRWPRCVGLAWTVVLATGLLVSGCGRDSTDANRALDLEPQPAPAAAPPPLAVADETQALRLLERARGDEATAEECAALARWATGRFVEGDPLEAFGGSFDDRLATIGDLARRGDQADLELYLVDTRVRALLDAASTNLALTVASDVLGRSEGSPERIASLALVAATAARRAARLSEADALLDAAETALERAGESEWTARFWGSLYEGRGRVAKALGRPDAAAAFLDRALPWAEQGGDGAQLAALEVEQADLWLALDRHATLERQLERALDRPEVQERADVVAALELCRATSRVIVSRGGVSVDESLADELEALAGGPLQSTDALRARLRAAEVCLRAERPARAAALLTATAPDLPGVGERFDRTLHAWLAAWLGRVTAEGQAQPERTETARAALTDAEQALERLAADLADDPLRRDGVGLLQVGERRGLMAEVMRLQRSVHGVDPGVRRSFATLAQIQSIATRHRTRGEVAAAFDVDTLLVGPDHGVLLFLPAIQGSELLVFDAEGATAFSLPSVREINRRRADFSTAFDPRRLPSAWHAAAADLAKTLLPGPARARMRGWSRVSIAGTDLLRWVPFELLPFDGERRLGEVLSVAYVPDLPTAARLAERAPSTAPSGAPDLALVAGPELRGPAAGLSIPLDAQDLRGLTAGAEASWTRTGSRATAAALAEASLSGATV